VKKRTSKSAVPAILPREVLTKKARAAIRTYALIKCGEATIIDFLVRYVLEAERMRRVDLYSDLERRGWRWKARYGVWEQQKGKDK
jgi:hypothetical protein